MKLVYDKDVCGEVYMEDKWPNIRYFKDWGIYIIGKHKVAVIGGAYSVDKLWRLETGAGWFEDEQLSDEEMLQCTIDLTDQEVDFVLTHTCPYNWSPMDLFLKGIDQSSVDVSMELFLEEIAQCFSWKVWCFAHYHEDRTERPGVEQFYYNIVNIEDIWDRWQNGNIDPWLIKSPMFYAEDFILKNKENK